MKTVTTQEKKIIQNQKTIKTCTRKSQFQYERTEMRHWEGRVAVRRGAQRREAEDPFGKSKSPTPSFAQGPA